MSLCASPASPPPRPPPLRGGGERREKEAFHSVTFISSSWFSTKTLAALFDSMDRVSRRDGHLHFRMLRRDVKLRDLVRTCQWIPFTDNSTSTTPPHFSRSRESFLFREYLLGHKIQAISSLPRKSYLPSTLCTPHKLHRMPETRFQCIHSAE